MFGVIPSKLVKDASRTLVPTNAKTWDIALRVRSKNLKNTLIAQRMLRAEPGVTVAVIVCPVGHRLAVIAHPVTVVVGEELASKIARQAVTVGFAGRIDHHVAQRANQPVAQRMGGPLRVILVILVSDQICEYCVSLV